MGRGQAIAKLQPISASTARAAIRVGPFDAHLSPSDVIQKCLLARTLLIAVTPTSSSPRFRRLSLLAALLAALAPGVARAETALFSLAIGYNGAPADADAASVRSLRYADDDAAAFHQLARGLARRSYLLAILDADTQSRFPGLAEEAGPPSLAGIERAVEALNQQLAAASRAGLEPVVLVFYSGHGRRREDGPASLTLLDGELTQQVLYDRILGALKARYVHLLVDACHAEAVVHPRDVQAAVVDARPADVASYLSEKTLARFPHVGAIVASTSNAQAHEWDAYQRGVFTHEVLSGLRGAADVDGNGQIEYSELAAFLAAANRSVLDPRARLETVVRPPPLNPRAPLADLRALPGMSRLRGEPAPLGALTIEDARGARLLDLRAEPGFAVNLVLPADQTLFVRSRDREAEVRLRPGQSQALDRLAFHPTGVRPRDALDSSLRRGLFATGFGPAYYRGFVDRASDLISVDLTAREPAVAEIEVTPAPPARRVNWWVAGAAGTLAASAGVFTGLSLDARGDYHRAAFERETTAARDRYDRDRAWAIGLGSAAVVAAGVGLWLWWHNH
jgi:hypothetical protein